MFEACAAQGFNHIPVAREIVADMDTPLSAYLKLAGGPRSFLLESVVGGEKWGRYSMIGLTADTLISVSGRRMTVEVGSKVVSRKDTDDPLAEIEAFRRQHRVPHLPGLPRFTGGLVGYFGYDAIRYIEPAVKLRDKPDPLGCPDILLMVANRVLVFDNLRGRAILILHVDPAQDEAYRKACHEIDLLADRLRTAGVTDERPTVAAQDAMEEPRSGFPREQHGSAVEHVKRLIVDGDVMQVVLSQRLTAPLRAPPLNLYRALRALNPSPYMYFLNFADFQVVGASPEVLVRLEDGVVTVRPIAGTRPRGASEEDDARLERELLADAKELAEHLMLIDLGRNDVGRVARVGTVEVTERMVIERYSHVMHIVSNVRAELAENLGPLDVLRAAFPAGTVSGAPKVRAMQIIDELEPVKRGIYAGAVGYLSWAGNLDTAIAIRTAIVKDGLVHVQAGGGIVADSTAEAEWQETLNKSRALFRAAAMAEAGLE
jgi:anthranilate synthase component 1